VTTATAARASIATNPRVAEFNRWVRANYGSQDAMADALVIGRSHLSQVLHGKRGGRQTWKRLVMMLPWAGLSLLELCPSWNNDARAALAARRGRAKRAEKIAAEDSPERVDA
jgi:hypothetical protein